MINNKAFESQDDLSRISLPGTGLRAESAMQTPPELIGVFQDRILGAQLDITDHFPRKMLINERTYRRACPAVEAFQGGIFSKTLDFIGKFRIY